MCNTYPQSAICRSHWLWKPHVHCFCWSSAASALPVISMTEMLLCMLELTGSSVRVWKSDFSLCSRHTSAQVYRLYMIPTSCSAPPLCPSSFPLALGNFTCYSFHGWLTMLCSKVDVRNPPIAKHVLRRVRSVRSSCWGLVSLRGLRSQPVLRE